ncbi:VacJ family lipoprotein [Sphingomonas sp. TF3]|uniref:MlaA family lipoprotein n=1 Tax=Sphingomonas sp. TF3 TaxID=2495580 RepID=UPI000F891AD4|nr:VacJ family lipoprotein [Sphingomonas sp. TF3]RUN75652.1 VacJ family lipoprotein [Sphingomonas sp. TF3]
MTIRSTTSALAVAIALLAAPLTAAPQSAPAPVAAGGQATPPVVALAPVTAGQASVRHHHHAKGDSLEGFNRVMFSIHQFLDRIFLRPVSMAYKKIVPKVVRTGIRHVFSNVGEPLVFANDLLQLKPKRAIRTLARFGVNSTIGIGGLLDVAKTSDFNLPHHDNSFGNTLGRYGVGPGPYIFLPLVGPNTLRDFGAGVGEGSVLPLTVGTPFDRAEYQAAQAGLTGIDLRAESDAELKALLGAAVDPYATLRSAFLQDRAATIAELRHGTKQTSSPLDDPLNDPGATEAVPAASASAGSAKPATDDLPADPAPPADEKSAAPSAPAQPSPAP